MGGWSKIEHWFMRSTDFTIHEKAIFTYLSCFNPCYVSIALMAKELKIDKKVIHRSLNKLQISGLIKRTKTFGRSNTYTLLGMPNKEAIIDVDKSVDNNVDNLEPGVKRDQHQGLKGVRYQGLKGTTNKNKNKNNVIRAKSNSHFNKMVSIEKKRELMISQSIELLAKQKELK